jgi:hypothetical protein
MRYRANANSVGAPGVSSMSRALGLPTPPTRTSPGWSDDLGHPATGDPGGLGTFRQRVCLAGLAKRRLPLGLSGFAGGGRSANTVELVGHEL